MPSKQLTTVAVLVTVFAWSTVMTVLGQLAAMAALLPSLGLLIQQITAALTGPEQRHTTTPGPAPAGPATTREEPSR